MPDTIIFSYKLCTSDDDTMHKKIESVNLQNDITAEGFARIIRGQIRVGSSGKIELTKKIFNANMAGIPVTKHITLYVDNKVKTQDDIHKILLRKFEKGVDCFSYHPNNKQKYPAVITETVIHRKNGYTPDCSREESWNEHHPVVESLNAETDVLVNYDLNEIWPESTGVIPKIVKDFFENER